MACERLWFAEFTVKLFLVAVGFSLVVAEDREAFFYRSESPALSSLHWPVESVDFVLHDDFLVRNRRAPVETLNSTIETTTIAIASNSSVDDVAYSTNDTVNSTQATEIKRPEPTVQVKEVIVSDPLNPADGKEVSGTVWANATRAPNVTKSSSNVTGNIDDDDGVTEANDDISINKFGDLSNSTLSQNNITKTEDDSHHYYNSSFIVDEAVGRSYWINLTDHPGVQVNELLSKSHRRAATVKLSFDFPFYGHMVRNVTIATGGFLYTGEYVHSWLAATQYIAPLMANFDTRLLDASYVKYMDNGTVFVVEWEKVVLQEKPEAGEFSFQVILHKNGDIVFVYSAIPLFVENIKDNSHPVKVGLSDAYIIDRTVFFVRRKTIYEYHRVNFNHQDIKNWTVIYLTALPTCLRMENCTDCLKKTTEFDCKWCPIINRCSTGIDRYKQDWLMKGCEARNIKESGNCPANITATTTYSEHDHDHEEVVHANVAMSANVQSNQEQAKALGPMQHEPDKMRMGVSGIIGIFLIVALITGLVGWATYAYRNPHTASGQILIRYRPSQWSWRRGEARYTAATIHM